MATLFDKWTFEGSSLVGELGKKLSVYLNPTFSTDQIKEKTKPIISFGTASGFLSSYRFTDNTNITAISAFRLNADSAYTVHYECQVLGISDGAYLGSAITVSNGNKIGVGYYGTGHVLVPSAVTIQKGKWYIIAYRKTGDIIDVFLDGQKIHTVAVHPAHGGAPYLTGQYCNSGGQHSRVNRSYAELIAYEGALSDEEIKALSAGVQHKMLVFHEEQYKTYVNNNLVENGLIQMADGALTLSTASTVTRALHIRFNKDITLKKVSYKAGYANTLGFRIYDKNTKQRLYSKSVAMSVGYNTFIVDDIKLLKDTDYLIGFYGAYIYGRTIASPTTLLDPSTETNLTIYSRYDVSSDAFPATPVTTTYPIMHFEFTIDIEQKAIGWLTVEGNQMKEEGITSLEEISQKRIVELDPVPMNKKE